MIWNHAYPAGFPNFRFTLHAKQSGKKKNEAVSTLTAYH